MLRGFLLPSIKQLYSSSSSSGLRAFSTYQPNVYGSYTIYTETSTLSLDPIRPMLGKIPSGLRVTRRGTFLFTMAARIDGSVGDATTYSGNTTRRYDWEGKSSFALSPKECGTLLATFRGGGIVGDSVVFSRRTFSDQIDNKESRVYKELSVVRSSPPMEGGLGMIDITMTVEGRPDIRTSVDLGEWVTIEELMKYSIPRLLAFDKIFDAKQIEADNISESPFDDNWINENSG